jgi:hypothetical protein
LEETVTKLHMASGYSPEDLAMPPPPLVKIRELEQENLRLEKENEDLRRMLATSGRNLSPEIPRRSAISPFQDARSSDHNFERKKMLGTLDGTYLVRIDSYPRWILGNLEI